jgi:outer membrane protein assembly factor BamB
LTCLDRNTGKALWVTDQEVIYGKGTKGVHAGSSITVVVSDEHEMVYTCHPGAFIIGYALKSGEEIWRTPVEVVNYHAPPDLFVIGDTIWANDETGYDAKSGEAVSKRTFSFDRPMGHDRCYRGRATPQYIIESKSGGADFSVLNSDEEFANPWIRGACQYGVLPCNGLLYAPPHPCQCARSSMLAGFYAMAPEREGYSGLRCSDVLEKGPSFGINRDSEVIAAGQNEWPTFRHNEARGSATKNYVGKNLKVKWKKKVASTRPSASTIVDGKVFLADVDAHSVIALEQESGNTIWEYTTGARVDTPPTWHDDSVLFGSRDGWVYCLRAEDGDLIWRFRAAPEERYVGVHEQIESEWPVHGSVLVKDGNAYFSAGRSSFMGNGIYLYSLDAKTGKKIDQKRLHGPLDEEGHPVIEISHHNDIVGAKSSILSANGDQIYLRHLAFDNELREVREDETNGHIMPSAGFLDDQLFHRSLWTFGRRMGISERPDGDVLVLDDDRLYCHVGHGSGRGAGTTFLEQGYAIFGGTVEEVSWTESRKPEKFVDMDGKTSFFRIKGDWKSRINLAPRAMIKAGEYLYVAGTVHQYPPEQDDPWGAVEGRKGNMLEVYKEEEKVLSLELDGFPVWDGMAAANGKLFISLMNGDLLCLAE